MNNFFKDMDVVITRGASQLLSDENINEALRRHSNKDWGNVSDEDKKTNDEAYEVGGMLLSSYTFEGQKIWVITDYGWKDTDHKVTTILLPEEY